MSSKRRFAVENNIENCDTDLIFIFKTNIILYYVDIYIIFGLSNKLSTDFSGFS